MLLNRLLVTVASDFWRTDQEGVIELVKTIEPFQRTGPAAWPVGDEAPITLRSLCALLGLWQAYRDFGARFWLSFSELHMLIITHEFGPQPNHPLYRDRNMFATNDYAANVMMARDKGLMIEKDGTFALSPAGPSEDRAHIRRMRTAHPASLSESRRPTCRFASSLSPHDGPMPWKTLWTSIAAPHLQAGRFSTFIRLLPNMKSIVFLSAADWHTTGATLPPRPWLSLSVSKATSRTAPQAVTATGMAIPFIALNEGGSR